MILKQGSAFSLSAITPKESRIVINFIDTVKKKQEA